MRAKSTAARGADVSSDHEQLVLSPRRREPVLLAGVSGPPPSLGDFIRRQRELSAMSMREFARLAGISNPYLSQIERGLRAPSEQVLRSIADALEMSADALYEQAGVPADVDEGTPAVVEAIRADQRLSGRQRQALIEVYEAFAATGPRPARARRRGGTADRPGEDAGEASGARPG